MSVSIMEFVVDSVDQAALVMLIAAMRLDLKAVEQCREVIVQAESTESMPT